MVDTADDFSTPLRHDLLAERVPRRDVDELERVHRYGSTEAAILARERSPAQNEAYACLLVCKSVQRCTARTRAPAGSPRC